MKLRGMHNVENVAAAFAAGIAAGASIESMNGTAKRFDPVEHRLEFVAEIEGVKFYNDSKATSVDATLKALEAFAQERGKGCVDSRWQREESAVRAARTAGSNESEKARAHWRGCGDDRERVGNERAIRACVRYEGRSRVVHLRPLRKVTWFCSRRHVRASICLRVSNTAGRFLKTRWFARKEAQRKSFVTSVPFCG